MEEGKNKRIAKNLLIFTLYVCAFMIAVFTAFTVPVRWRYKPLFLIGGLFIGWVFTALSHEIGHVIGAKLNDFEVSCFSFLIFKYDKQALKKVSFSFKDSYLGETDVLPRSVENVASRYVKVILGGILGSAFAALVLTAGFVLFMTFGLPKGAVFFCGMPFSLIILIINAVPDFVPENDGAKLVAMIARKEEKRAMTNMLEITAELFCGKSYAEIPTEKFDFEDGVSELTAASFYLLRLRRAEELFDPVGIVENLERLQNSCAGGDDEAAVEIFFANILLKDDEAIKKYDYLLDKCDTLPGASGMRVLVYYANYRGDEKYVRATLKSAKKICAQAYLRGDGKFNEIMLSRLEEML